LQRRRFHPGPFWKERVDPTVVREESSYVKSFRRKGKVPSEWLGGRVKRIPRIARGSLGGKKETSQSSARPFQFRGRDFPVVTRRVIKRWVPWSSWWVMKKKKIRKKEKKSSRKVVFHSTKCGGPAGVSFAEVKVKGL